MSESEDSGPGRREVAHRLFAAEFDDSEFSYSESDEERAPNYVVTPTGARVNRLFAVGVLTELEQVNEDVLRARVVDPTGPFVVYAGQYQPEALAFLEGAEPPLFVAVTGKARTFEPEDSDRVFTSIRPESISEVDAETRDRWVVQATEQTIERVGRTASAKQSGLSGDELTGALAAAGASESDAAGTTLALEYYGTTGEYLEGVRDLALDCARVVAGERDEAGTLSLSPGDGSDAPLSALATMDITPTAEATDATPATGGATTAGESPTAETGTAEGSTETAERESTEEGQGTAEGSIAAEPETTEATAEERPAEGDATETVDVSGTASEPASGTATADDSEALGDFDSGGSGADDGSDVGEFDAEFELDEDEREEIESEYGTDFQSGTEVDDAGEADIDTPDPEELAEMEGGASEQAATDGSVATDTESSTETADTDTTAETADAEDAADAEDVNLEDAVMAVMTDLDDGGGADREAVVATVVDQYGADRDAVADAIQDALMGGRCYEPDDGKLTPI